MAGIAISFAGALLLFAASTQAQPVEISLSTEILHHEPYDYYDVRFTYAYAGMNNCSVDYQRLEARRANGSVKFSNHNTSTEYERRIFTYGYADFYHLSAWVIVDCDGVVYWDEAETTLYLPADPGFGGGGGGSQRPRVSDFTLDLVRGQETCIDLVQMGNVSDPDPGDRIQDLIFWSSNLLLFNTLNWKFGSSNYRTTWDSQADLCITPASWWGALPRTQRDTLYYFVSDGTVYSRGSIFMNVAKPTGIEDDSLPTNISAEIYPNPLRSFGTIGVSLDEYGQVQTVVFDAAGREVMRPATGLYPPGHHRIPVDVSHIPNGVYFVSISVGENRITKHVIIQR